MSPSAATPRFGSSAGRSATAATSTMCPAPSAIRAMGASRTSARGGRTEVREAPIARIAEGAGHIVDVAAVALRPADEPNRGVAADGDIHEALRDVAPLATERLARESVACLEAGDIRLVGDDAHRARLRARAVERALRSGERLYALDVVDVDVERTLDGGDRLLIQVHADTRQGP